MTASTDFTVQNGSKDAYVPQGASSIAIVQSLFVYVSAATAADTVAISLAKHGMTTVKGVEFGYFSTADSVYESVAMVTTAVSGDTLTLTVPAGASAEPCMFRIYYI